MNRTHTDTQTDTHTHTAMMKNITSTTYNEGNKCAIHSAMSVQSFSQIVGELMKAAAY